MPLSLLTWGIVSYAARLDDRCVRLCGVSQQARRDDARRRESSGILFRVDYTLSVSQSASVRVYRGPFLLHARRSPAAVTVRFLNIKKKPYTPVEQNVCFNS